MTFSSQKRGGVTLSAGEHRQAKRQPGYARAFGVAPPLFALVLTCPFFWSFASFAKNYQAPFTLLTVSTKVSTGVSGLFDRCSL